METYKIKTDLLGEIELSKDDGIYEDLDIIIDSEKRTISFFVHENFLDDNNIKIVENYIHHIPEMHKKAKTAISEGKYSNGMICNFIESNIDDIEGLDWTDEFFSITSNDKISIDMVAEKLEIRGICIYPDKEKDIISCYFDFSLPEEYTDELLVFYFDEQYEIYCISHES